MKTKKCELCGDLFIPKSNRARYCKKNIVVVCKTCRKEFETQCYRGHPEYCSKKCAGASSISKTKTKKCPICGDFFYPTNNNQRYCMKTITKTCVVCGKEFESVCTLNSQIGRGNTCSDECNSKYRSIQIAESFKKTTKKCRICGKEFHPTTNTNSICNRDHHFKCIECGKDFVIENKYLAGVPLENIRKTCSRSCYSRYLSKHNPFKLESAKDNYKETMKSQYGVEYPAQSSEIQTKMKETYRKKTGYDYPMRNPEVRSKVAKSGKLSKLEAHICELFDNYDIEYEQHYCISENGLTHEFDFYLPQYKFLIDADGVYYHSYLSDPDGKHSIDYYDDIRVSLVPNDHIFHVIVEGQEDKEVKKIADILKNIDNNIFDYDSHLFNWCRSIDFPYPYYTRKRLVDDWTKLNQYQNVKYVPQCRIGESIIKQFHKSIFECRVGTNFSPLEGWYNDEKLKAVIRNRLIYVNNVDPSKILRGFNISKICPVVSMFNPILTKYIIQKYLTDVYEVFDPFSGFSGRLLGVTASNKKYIGQDLNEKVVKESNQIIDYLNISRLGSITIKDIFDSEGQYESLLTCPPYGTKEIYNTETVFKSCDEWIDECLQRFKCKKYVFVVDETYKYSQYVVEEIKSTSHFSKVSEKLVVI